MREKEPQFTVTDRRKFTAEGELREGEGSSSESTPAVTERVTPAADPQTATTEPDLAASPAMDDAELIPEPTAAEFAQLNMEYQAAALRLNEMVQKANPGQPVPPPMSFDRLVESLYMTAAMQMGAGATPNEQPRIDIMGAKQSIDTLMVLHEKATGNVNDTEKRMLQNALFDLCVSFKEITDAIFSSAQRAPKTVKPH